MSTARDREDVSAGRAPDGPRPQSVNPPGWPRGTGYSHGMVGEGRVITVAGQIGWDPVTHEVVTGGIAEQIRRALQNVVAVLEAAGAAPTDLVRLTWFITDRELYLHEAPRIGAVYREVIGRHFPPMSVVVVAALLEPGAQVEIEATAVAPRPA